ncbi:WcbI family polysaccharide biosynthesis putative acetyltransferase [Falsiroseomonas sp.]|uniref:WcbI family polysaccharide biosynthesis putative acetyltransferase n=1 Tax=Falsiroseomonas sp. TaxID=2870721 RepID=UPI003F726A3D
MKTAAIYGNCQANALGALLQVSAEFKAEYRFLRMPPVHRISGPALRDFLAQTAGDLGVLIHQPVSAAFRGGGFGAEDIRRQLGPATQVLSFPSLQFYGYQASAYVLTGLPLEAREIHHAIFATPSADVFHFSQVVRAFLDGAPEAEALRLFHEGYPGDAAFVTEMAARSIAQTRQAEVAHGLDIRVADFTAAQFRDQFLYNTPRHPAWPVLRQVLEQIAARLEITFTEAEWQRAEARAPLRFPQYPMQRFVSAALGLTFEREVAFRNARVALDPEALIAAFYQFYQRIPRRLLEQNQDRRSQAA